MKKFSICLAIALGLNACSASKQYFNPENTESYPIKSTQSLKTSKNFIGEDEIYSYFATQDGMLKLINKTTKESSEFHFDTQVVSARVHGNLCAFVDAKNTVWLYDLIEQKALFSHDYGASYGVISPLPSPKFSDTLVLIPTLDGKLVVLNHHNMQVVKVLTLGSKEFFNNIIYFDTQSDRMIALTSSKATTIVSTRNFSMINSFKAAASDYERIYLFTANGDVIKTDYALHELEKEHFEFANFKAALLKGDVLYALEFSGKLLKLDANTLKPLHIWDFKNKLSQESGFSKDAEKVIINSKIYPLQ